TGIALQGVRGERGAPCRGRVRDRRFGLRAGRSAILARRTKPPGGARPAGSGRAIRRDPRRERTVSSPDPARPTHALPAPPHRLLRREAVREPEEYRGLPDERGARGGPRRGLPSERGVAAGPGSGSP